MNKINNARLIAGVLIATLSHGLAAPVNDTFANAIVLTGNGGALSGNNTSGASLEVGEPECFYPGTNNTVWFKWVCTHAGNFTLSTKGSTNDVASDWDAVLCLYTGSTLGTLSEVVKQDAGVDEAVTVAVTPGTYYIQAGGYPNPPADVATDIVLTWSLAIPPPPITAVVSVDVVRSSSTAVSGDAAGSPVTGQTGPWNQWLGSSMPATLTGLTDGAGGVTGIGLNAAFSGTTGFQASTNSSPAVLAANNPERLWATGTGTLTLRFTGLTVGGNYGLVIYNTGSTKGTITINGGTTHTAVSSIFTSSETADGSGNITAVVGFVGGAHSDYMEVSGLQVYPLAALSTLAASAGTDKEVTPGAPAVVIGGSPSASGGSGPYTYSWNPTTGLDDPTAANPTASPTVTTSYTLTVTDSLSAKVTDEVTVTYTVPALVANAGTDKTVTPGSPSAAIGGSPSASGGSGTYTYSWAPITGLDDPSAANPNASPTSTTTYALTVTDSLGTPQATDEVTVTFETPPAGSADLVSVDVVRSGGPAAVSGDVAGSPFTDQVGSWNAFNGSAMTSLSNLINGDGGISSIGLSITKSGTTGFQASINSSPAVLAANNPERLWATGTGTLTLTFTGLTVGGAYDLAIYNTGSTKGTITINGGSTHTGVSTIYTSSETADGSGKITAVVGFAGDAHSDYMEFSGVQLKASGAGPSGYAAWADLHAGGQTADLDYNHDGVANGVAYFMGKDGLASNPGLVGGKITWPHLNAVASFAVQVSDNLADWSPANPADIDTTTDPGLVIYTLPSIAPKQFCRLMVTP